MRKDTLLRARMLLDCILFVPKTCWFPCVPAMAMAVLWVSFSFGEKDVKFAKQGRRRGVFVLTRRGHGGEPMM